MAQEEYEVSMDGHSSEGDVASQNETDEDSRDFIVIEKGVLEV